LVLGVSAITLTAIIGISETGMWPPSAQAESPVDQQTRTAVGDLLARIDAAWNRGDASDVAAAWTENGTVVSPMGVLTAGRGAIETDMQAQFAGPMKGSSHALAIERVLAIEPGVVLVDGTASVRLGDQGPWKANFTAVLTNGAGNGWLVSHMRSYVHIQQ
jgi:uncharacterized protein (TIGR02246 family)